MHLRKSTLTFGLNRLAILPNLTHYEMFMAPAMLTTLMPFLNGEQGAPVWTPTRDK